MRPKVTVYEKIYWARIKAAKNTIVKSTAKPEKPAIERISPIALKYRIKYFTKMKEKNHKPVIAAEMDE